MLMHKYAGQYMLTNRPNPMIHRLRLLPSSLLRRFYMVVNFGYGYALLLVLLVILVNGNNMLTICLINLYTKY